jgi:zinc protease
MLERALLLARGFGARCRPSAGRRGIAPLLLPLLLPCLVVGTASAQAPPTAVTTSLPTPAPKAKDPALASLERLALSIQRLTLENGLRVVLNQDSSSPTIAVSVTYDVGARNEGPGQSGFAHLFEHMMFQGSKNVKRGQHFLLISERGGTLNGTTSGDRTNYFESMPSSELELALFLEADRMRWLSVTAENLENQRAVVKEEYRMRVDNAPYGKSRLRLQELVFRDYPPYAHPTIGSMADLDAAKLEWVQSFFASHYGPNNAVLTIAGDFDADRAVEMVRKYFGGAERRAVPPFDETAGTAARSTALEQRSTAAVAKTVANESPREVVPDLNVKTPGVYYGYRIPPRLTKDHAALELAALLLTDGESSRLYQRLVRDRALLQSVSAWTNDHRGPDLFGIFAALSDKAKLAEVERLLELELQKLRSAPPDEKELERVKSRVKHHFVFDLQANRTRAVKLGEYEVFFGDARTVVRDLEAYLAVTPADVKRVAAEYLLPERRVVVEVRPGAAGGAKP